jgi:hypothetical protein
LLGVLFRDERGKAVKKKNTVYETSLVKTKNKRERRTKAQLEALDNALYLIIKEQKPMGVRQVFYQATVRGLVPKDEGKGYDVVARRLLVMRRNGTLPYSWIVDNSRSIYGDELSDSLEEFARDVASLYRKNYWRDAPERVEIWLEKDALAGVLSPVTKEHALWLYVTRGFPSETYLYHAAETAKYYGKPTYIYVLSDFDPSGFNLYNQAKTTLERMAPEIEWHIERIALTLEQITSMSLSTRPLKNKKENKKFLDLYGDISAELDAIPPNDLRELVRRKILEHMDEKTLANLKAIEQSERQALELFEIPQIATDDYWIENE